MAKRRSGNPSKKWGGGNFNAFPHCVLVSVKFAELSPQATKLLLDLFSQYRGNNNGDLCAAMTLMKPRGWKSNASLANALKELIDTGFVILTRQGGRNSPSLYAITFYAIDDCEDKRGCCKFDPHLGVKPTASPRNDWLRGTPAPDLEKAKVEAKKRKKEAEIIDLKNHLKANPNDKYADNYRKAIEEYERQAK